MDLETTETIRQHRDYLLNVLNEMLYGFPVDFETALHVQKEDVLSLFKRLDHGQNLELSSQDALLLLNGSQLCLKEFDRSEFESRLGEKPGNAQRVNQFLTSLISDTPDLSNTRL